MPAAWQPDSIYPITSQSWKKHQKLGQDCWSLCSVLDNEAVAPRVRVGNGLILPNLCRLHDGVRNAAYTNSESTSSCTKSASSAKQRLEEAGLGGAQEELWISFRAYKAAPCAGEAIKEIS